MKGSRSGVIDDVACTRPNAPEPPAPARRSPLWKVHRPERARFHGDAQHGGCAMDALDESHDDGLADRDRRLYRGGDTEAAEWSALTFDGDLALNARVLSS